MRLLYLVLTLLLFATVSHTKAQYLKTLKIDFEAGVISEVFPFDEYFVIKGKSKKAISKDAKLIILELDRKKSYEDVNSKLGIIEWRKTTLDFANFHEWQSWKKNYKNASYSNITHDKWKWLKRIQVLDSKSFSSIKSDDSKSYQITIKMPQLRPHKDYVLVFIEKVFGIKMIDLLKPTNGKISRISDTTILLATRLPDAYETIYNATIPYYEFNLALEKVDQSNFSKDDTIIQEAIRSLYLLNPDLFKNCLMDIQNRKQLNWMNKILQSLPGTEDEAILCSILKTDLEKICMPIAKIMSFSDKEFTQLSRGLITFNSSSKPSKDTTFTYLTKYIKNLESTIKQLENIHLAYSYSIILDKDWADTVYLQTIKKTIEEGKTVLISYKNVLGKAKKALISIQNQLTTNYQAQFSSLRAYKNGNFLNSGSTSYTLSGRMNNYIHATAGLAFIYSPLFGNPVFRHKSIIPYVGVNYNIRPINRDVPLAKVHNIRWYQKFSYMIGITLNSVAEENERKDLLDNKTILTGLSYRFNNAFRITAGGLVFRQVDQNPAISNTDIATSFFVGLELDITLLKSLKDVGKALFPGVPVE